ncbi:hypothetical protein [Streptomyces sp. C]|uniref:hypothetical protein n=1 Tax=Streptomyces sp. C TaxID=253839 RepID=UPI0001B57BFA|nr:hypothetical protein [Streptomyces sp. C]EFL12776.1 predicted protein [Streptomyces sp. C]
MDDAATLSPPRLSAVVQALKELVERLWEDPKVFTAEAAVQLRAAASSELLVKELVASAGAKFHMGGRQTGRFGARGPGPPPVARLVRGSGYGRAFRRS